QDPAHRTAPALRSLDPGDGLSPSGQPVQPRQAVRTPRAPPLPRARRHPLSPPSRRTSAGVRPEFTAMLHSESRYPQLPVAGLTPMTTLDYPDHLACVIFLQGCPLRCGYCHNAQMLAPRRADAWEWAEIE